MEQFSLCFIDAEIRKILTISFLRILKVIPLGLEPKAYCLEGSCSIQLSYGTALFVIAAAKVDIFFGLTKHYVVNLM